MAIEAKSKWQPISDEVNKIATLEDLDRDLEQNSLEGHWRMELPRVAEPKSKLRPMLWRWTAVRDRLLRAGDLITVDEAGRRTVRLCNPGLLPRKATTHTMQMSFQMVLPGEVARVHRHTMAALRFVLEGSGTYTTVEGDSFLMEPGDFILTPLWTWHDHMNESEEPIIWIDGLDVPFVMAMDCIFIDEPEWVQQKAQRVVQNSEQAREAAEARGWTWDFKWKDTERALRDLAARRPDPTQELVYRYPGKNGGHTLPTLSCGVQMLEAGEQTRARRQTSSTAVHVFRGRGTTVIGDATFEWERGDSFVVPNWMWSHHQNRSDKEEAMLFFMSDRAVQEPLGLYREELQAG